MMTLADQIMMISDNGGDGDNICVLLSHGGGWSRKINAWYLYTLMVYL